jgi:outer membrane protein assembly factor BamB
VLRSPQISAAFGPTLVIQDDVVLLSGSGGASGDKARTRRGGEALTAFSATDGKILWTEQRPKFSLIFSHDLPVIDGKAWIGEIGGSEDSGTFKGYDIHTGEVQSEFEPDIDAYWFHHRCYPPKATLKYILTSRNGVEFVDLENQSWQQNHWMRGSCIYGIMPANGMIYLPQNACACYVESKLTGLCAVAPERASQRPVVAEERLEKGPAYHDSSAWKPSGTAVGDWPVYRHDPARSGTSTTVVPVDSGRLWKTTLNPSRAEGRLSQPVVADGRVFVAVEDEHAVYALDEATGAVQWSYVAGGRIDSAPAFYRGRIIFGSNDGFVYCLRAVDGALAWRFRAAPDEQRHMAFEQIESVWPVSGSVLLLNDTVYCLAGRNMFLDGGMRLVRLDPLTGKTLSETVLDQRDPTTGENLQEKIEGMVMPAAQPDILSSDGTAIYLRSQRFNLDGVREDIGVIDVADQSGQDAHLFGNAGFLDDSWFYRTFWEYGRSVSGGYGTWPQSAQYVPYGRILVFNETSVFGFGRKPEHMRNMSFSLNHLFACVKTVTDEQIQAGRKKFSKDQLINDRAAPASNWAKWEPAEPGEITAVTYHWSSSNPPLLARALVLADDTLFAAGPPRVGDEQASFFSPDDAALKSGMKEQVEACRGNRGALLWAVSAADGKKLAEYPLDSPPSFDGMSSANQRLYVSCLDGTVVCFGRVAK